MKKTEIEQHKSNLLGKWVHFRVGKYKHYGRVSSIEHDICNIKGFEQKRYERPDYHYNFQEVTICNHDEVFKLGRAVINALRP